MFWFSSDTKPPGCVEEHQVWFCSRGFTSTDVGTQSWTVVSGWAARNTNGPDHICRTMTQNKQNCFIFLLWRDRSFRCWCFSTANIKIILIINQIFMESFGCLLSPTAPHGSSHQTAVRTGPSAGSDLRSGERRLEVYFTSSCSVWDWLQICPKTLLWGCEVTVPTSLFVQEIRK